MVVKDIDLLQGAWAVTALEADGQQMPAAMLSNARILIHGDRFVTSGMGAAYEGTLELDSSAKPRQLNMKFDAGPEKGNTNLGIYELDGDTWLICIAPRGTVRPSTFASPAGSGFVVETLTRRSEAAKAPRSKEAGPATELEGEWRMISGTMDGLPMDDSAVKWVKRVTKGNVTTVYAGPQVVMSFEFSFDPAKSPKTLDYLNTAGSNAGETQCGIYELTGDLLTVCVAAPGAARPARFESLPGGGGMLTVWKRR